MRFRFTATPEGVGAGLDKIQQTLSSYGMKHSDITRKMLAAEEVMKTLLSHGPEAQSMQVSIRRIFDEITIDIDISGEEFSFEGGLAFGIDLDSEEVGVDTELTISNSILRSMVESLKYRHRNGINSVRITVVRSKRAMLYKTLGAMGLALILGILLRNIVSQDICATLNNYILIPGKNMFMNALKMTVAPVVFFSIASCIGQFGNLSEMGKIGRRIISLYLITTVVATLVGISLFSLFKPGEFASIIPSEGAISSAVQTINISIKDTIVNIIPNNFVRPFLEADMLQLIFLAVLCGAAVGSTGKYSKVLSDLFSAFNDLFLKITAILVQFVPLAAFCSILSMILQTGAEVFVSVLSILGVVMLGLAVMMLFYCLLMLFAARMSPIPFCKKYIPTMLQVFSMASSNAALPINISACNRLGISPKVYSLSLPLGATINMDGSCIYMGITALGLARLYGVEIPPAALLSVVISIIVLSVGAPGVPGSGMICLSVLITQLGLPVEAVALVMGIDPLVGMLRAMSNCLGDVSVSCIVAKQSNMLDSNTYKDITR